MHTTFFFWLLFSKIVIYYVFGNFASEEHHSTQHWSQSELTCGAEILFNLGSLLQLCKLQSIQCFFSLSHFLGLGCSQEPFFKKIDKHISICVLADTFGFGFHKWASLYTIFPDLHHSHILFCLSQLTLFAFSSLYICSRVFILPHLARSQSAVQFGEHLTLAWIHVSCLWLVNFLPKQFHKLPLFSKSSFLPSLFFHSSAKCSLTIPSQVCHLFIIFHFSFLRGCPHILLTYTLDSLIH